MIDSAALSASVLIVTGNELMRTAAAEVLAAEGYRVATAADAREGVEAMRSHRADVALIDTDDGGDGLGLMRSVAEAHPQTVIVGVARLSAIETVTEALRIGAYDYLPKPFTRWHLRETIARAAAVSREDPRTRPRHPPPEIGRF